MKIWVCSDSHFNHFNIIKYCNRPFVSLAEMNDTIVQKWNKTVADEDIVLFLGDFCFSRVKEAQNWTNYWASILKGHKIIVKGNHDFKKVCYCNAGFEYDIYQQLIVDDIMFCHSPYNLSEWCKQYRHVYYGHVHDKVIVNAPENSTNVCLDVHDFRPIDITNQLTEQESKTIQKLIKIDRQR